MHSAKLITVFLSLAAQRSQESIQPFWNIKHIIPQLNPPLFQRQNIFLNWNSPLHFWIRYAFSFPDLLSWGILVQKRAIVLQISLSPQYKWLFPVSSPYFNGSLDGVPAFLGYFFGVVEIFLIFTKSLSSELGS